MKTLLVTGGLGFIGSHTCLSLILEGCEVYLIDSLDNSSIFVLERILCLYKKQTSLSNKPIHFIQGDIRNYEVIEKAFIQANDDGNPIQGVIHFAGLKAVSESVINPILYWDVNVKGTINLLKAMVKNECKTIVYSSSATVYGSSTEPPIRENAFIDPINPYGQTKYSSELLLQDFFQSNSDEIRVAILRYFNPIGAHPSGMLGEAPKGIPNNIFPYICNVANGNIDKLRIFGHDWPTQDGSGVRDYIHVLDLAEGHLAALKYLFSETPQIITFNLGTGEGTSVINLVETFQRVNKISFDYIFTPRRAGDTAIIYANIDLALSHLNWRPQRTLEDMCRDGWSWADNNRNGYDEL